MMKTFKSFITQMLYYSCDVRRFFLYQNKPLTMEELDDIIFNEEKTVREMTEKLNQLEKSLNGMASSDVEVSKIKQDINLFIKNSVRKRAIQELKIRMPMYESSTVSTDGAWNRVWAD